MALNDRLGGSLATFCALLPVTDEPALRAEIEGWPTGAGSPFARIPWTHFARLVVVPELIRQVATQPADTLGRPYLVFSAFFDGDPVAWLLALCAELPAEADAAFRHCAGYPGDAAARGPAVRRWLGAHRVPATAIFGAYPDASVARIRDALAFREQFRRFAFGLEASRDGHARFAAFASGEEPA